jgi:hypothetical protein
MDSPAAHRAARLQQLLSHPGIVRSLLPDEPLRPARRGGAAGIDLTVHLTSYRSLPLSCIAAIELSIDAEPIDVNRLLFVLQGNEYRVADFPALSAVWWFILDPAVIFIPRDPPLSAGAHDVAATLVTVEPYMTAGRFAFHASAMKRLTVDRSNQVSVQ